MNDEKKKLAIVVVLFAVMACVGVFQLLGKKKAPAAPSTPIKVATAADKTVGSAPAGSTTADAATGAAQTATPKNVEVPADLPQRDPFQPPAGMIPPQGGTKIVGIPKHFGPTIKRGGFGPLVPGIGPGGFGLHPVEQKPFGWTCVGVIGGPRPAAMFEDGAGNQKLVTVGSAIDPDSRLKGIEDDAVSVDFRGKTLRLTVGGNPVGK